MGIVRRILEELLNIPLDKVRLDLWREFLPQVPDEALVFTLLVLATFLAMAILGLAGGVSRLVMRNPIPVLQLVALVVFGFLGLDTLVDFLLPVVDELRERL